MPDDLTPDKPAEGELPKTRDQDAIRSLFDWISKLLGVSVGVVYLVGFLVVARHLSKYGVSSFALFRIQYLVAGVWVIAPIVVMALFQRAGQRFTIRALEERRKGERTPLLRRLIVASIVSIPGALAIGAAAGFVGDIQEFSFSLAVWFLAFYISLVSTADLLWVSWNVPKGMVQRWWANRDALPFYGTLLISILLVYVLLFAVRVYPLIPYSLGGGKPLTVVFLMGEKETADFLVRDSSSHRSVPYKQLAATERTFVVLPSDPNQRSIEFNRDTVLGVVVLKEP